MKELVIVQEARLEGREEGREEGRAEGIAESIIAMISRGKSPEEIADFCGYPLKMIPEVKAGMKKV
jgi:predicted transposase YdaD